MQKIINHWRYFCNSVNIKIISNVPKRSAGLREINGRCPSGGSPLTAPHRHRTTRLANQETMAAAWMSTGGGGNEFTCIAIYLKKKYTDVLEMAQSFVRIDVSVQIHTIYICIYIYIWGTNLFRPDLIICALRPLFISCCQVQANKLHYSSKI